MIDPSIPLQVRPAQIQPVNPLEQYGQVLALKNAMQQNQVGAMQLHQQQQALLDDKTMREVLSAHNGDIETALPSLAGKVSAKTWLGLQNSWLEQQKNKLGMAKTQQEVADGAREAMGKLALGVQKAGNTPEAFQGAVDTFLKFNPSKEARAALAPYVEKAQQDPASIGSMMEQLIGGTEAGQKERTTAAAETRADAAKTQADVAQNTFNIRKPGMEAQAATEQLKAAGMTVPDNQDAWTAWRGSLPPTIAIKVPAEYSPENKTRVEQMSLSPMERATLKQRADEYNLAKQREDRQAKEGQTRLNLEGQRVGIEKQRFNATIGAGLDANGQPLPADAMRTRASQNPAAVAIAEYRMRPPAQRSGAVPPVMREVLALNPAYDATQFDARQKYRNALTSGAQGQALNSLNTAIEHLDQFVDVAKALGNGTFQPGNRAWNAMRETFGDSAPTNFEGMKTIMAGELASAFKKSGATDQEIHAVVSAINRQGSANQLVDYATKIAIPALGGKIHTYVSQTQAQMGEKDPLVGSIVTPGARAVLQKHGYNPDAGGHGAAGAGATSGGAGQGATAGSGAGTMFTVTDPRGVVHTFRTQQEADGFKRIAGIK